MPKRVIKRILSITICLPLFVSVVYADNVVVGNAPNDMGRTISQNAATSYLQNNFTGPGTLPNSANTLGTTPIGGIPQYTTQYTTSTGRTSIASTYADNNGVSDAGPTVKNISSPAANMNMLNSTANQSNVVVNSAGYKGSGTSSTSDNGPTVYEEPAPTADRAQGKTTSATIVNGQLIEPGTNLGSNQVASSYPNGVPSYYTGNNTAANTTVNNYTQNTNNTDVIIYQCNNTITSAKPNISAPGALLVNATTRQIYFAKGGFTLFAPASLANLVTAYILLQYKGLDTPLTVSATAVSNLESGAKTAGLKAGDTILVRDAIAAMFVGSCCDVANVAAENVSGNIANFVALMNQTTKNWGCINTVFTNPTGLNNNAQVTTTYDMAIIMDKVTQDPTLKLTLTIKAYDLPATSHRAVKRLTSKNNILSTYAGIGASRMGYTSKAKYTMASEIDYNGQRLIAIVLKANNTQFNDTTKLLNFGKVASIEAINNGSQGMSYGTSAIKQVANTQGTVATGAAGGNIFGSVNETAGSFVQDANGWYFIKANGQKATNEWIKQGGKLYCVDSTGYMITGWREFSNGKLYYFDPANGELRYNTWVNVSTGAYYLQADGTLATAGKGATKNIVTSVGTYTIDENGKAIAKVN